MKPIGRLCLGICLAGMLLMPVKESLAQPFPSCEDLGLTLIAKFELKGKSYKFEKPKGNEDLVSVDGDGKSATWSAHGATIEKIIVFGGGDYKIEDANGTGGTVTNTGLQNRGGQTPGISNIQFCGVKTPPPPPDNGIDCPCEGKATYLLLEYQGTETVEKISVRMRRGPSTDHVNVGTVNPGETFEVFGLPGPNPGFDGTLGTDIFIMYNGQEQQIHTSCSQPLFVGQVHGLFEVLAFASKQGGLCPPVDECPFVDPPTVEYEVFQENGDFFVRVHVTADVALTHVDIETAKSETNNSDPSITNLVLISSDEDFANGEATYIYQIVDLWAEYSVVVDARDECGFSCPDTEVPSTGTATSVDPNATEWTHRAQGLVDGLYYFQLFNINNITVANFRDEDGNPLVGDPLDGINLSPPVREIYYEITVLPGLSTHGALAANRCNAWIEDPRFNGILEQLKEAGVSGTAQVERPQELALGENYPNPFNPATRIDFALPEAATVSLVVYDVLGRQVAVLVDGYREAGQHNVLFDASHLTSGTYFYQLSAAETSITRRMVLMK